MVKVGDTVYQVDDCRMYPITVRKIIYDCGFIAFDGDAVGKSVFLSKDDAEKLINGGSENG